MLIKPVLLLSFILFGLSADADPNVSDERRLNTVTVTTLPPDKGELHINPIVLRPQNFERPGYSEVDLTFIAVDLIGDYPKPILSQEDQGRLKLRAKLPKREANVPFEDTVRDYKGSSVILPKGTYVLAEVGFRKSADQSPQKTLSYCLDQNSFAFDVIGGDVIYLGLLDVSYPTKEAVKSPDFSPIATVLANLETSKRWRWTTRELMHFKARALTFQRSEAFCKAESRSVLPAN